jgi:hypothetical protein
MNKKLIFSSICALLFSSMLQINSSFAQTNIKNTELLDSIKVNSTTSSIELTWNKSDEQYQVSYKGEVVSKGKKPSFVHRKLDPRSSYDYEIVKLDKQGNIMDRVSVTASTLDDTNSANNNPLDLVTVTVIKDMDDNVLKLDWTDVEGINTYEVSRNEEYVSNVNNSEYIDANPKFEQVEKYQFTGKKLISEERKQLKLKKLKEANITLNPIEEVEVFTETFNIIKVVEPRRTTQYDVSASSSKTYQLLYNTFIPLDYIDNPVYDVWGAPGNQYAFFGGDGANRGWSNDVNNTKYRTRTWSKATASTQGHSLDFNKKVGQTKGYDKNKNLIGTDTEGGRWISWGGLKTGTNYIQYTVSHASNNPLVPGSPDIDYTYTATFNTSGTYTIKGSHDQMPNHEFYLQYPGSSTFNVTLFKDTYKGLNYLWPHYEDKTFSISN